VFQLDAPDVKRFDLYFCADSQLFAILEIIFATDSKEEKGIWNHEISVFPIAVFKI
jgi:hypothetical protein